MKSLLFAAVASLALVASADLKIGTVDMMVLVRNHPKYDSDKQLLIDTEKDHQKKLDRMKSDLEEVQEEGKKLADQARNPMLKAEAKAKLEKQLLDIQNKFLAGQQKLRSEAMRSQQDISELEGRLLKATTEDLRKRMKAFAQDKGYDLIIDTAAAAFASDKLDVTDDALRAMGVDPKKAKAKAKDKTKNEGK